MANELEQRDRQNGTNRTRTPTTADRPVGKTTGVSTVDGVAGAARTAVLAARDDGRADSPDGINALAKLVTRPQDAFAAEGFVQTGVMVTDYRAATKQFAPLLAALPVDARAAYDAVIRLRRGDGLQAVIDQVTVADKDKDKDTDKAVPELQLMWAGKYGRYDFKGGIKLIPKTNALVTVKDQAVKIKASSVAVGLENAKGKISQALVDTTFDATKLPYPFEAIAVKLQTKFFDLKNFTELKIATIVLKLVGELPSDLLPQELRDNFTLVLEASVEHGITPEDLGSVSELRTLTEKALARAAELVQWRDKVRASQQVIEQLSKRKAALEELVKDTAPRFIKGGKALAEGANYRAAQRELTMIGKQLLQHGEQLEVATVNAGRLGKLFGALHEEWLVLFSRMSPLLLRFRGPVTEWVCARLATVIGSRIFGAIHPILLIAMMAYDLAYLIKFLIDLCRGKLTYVGWGKGDYEPSLLDWGPAGSKADDGTVAGTTEGKTDGGEVEPEARPIDKLTGPRARLARLLMSNSVGEKMTPAQSARLISIIERYEVTNDDINRIIAALTPVTSVDQALDLLEKALQAKTTGTTTDTTLPTDKTTGGTGGKTTGTTGGKTTGTTGGKTTGTTGGKTTGGGDSEQTRDTSVREQPIRNLQLGGVDRGGKRSGRSLGWTATGNTATITVGRDADGNPVTARVTGRVKLVGPYIEFHVDEPGLREMTFQVGRWDKAAKKWVYQEATGRLYLPPILRKYAPGKQPVKSRK